jgi:hypothetical protein
MLTSVPEKLLAIVDDIDAGGDANLTRLTVLKKWFERPGRLVPFALWVPTGHHRARERPKARPPICSAQRVTC